MDLFVIGLLYRSPLHFFLSNQTLLDKDEAACDLILVNDIETMRNSYFLIQKITRYDIMWIKERIQIICKRNRGRGKDYTRTC